MTVTTTVPLGAGLSSSASYAVAIALALGATGDAWELAELAQAAEAAAGANVGLLDQVAVLSAREGFATAIDFTARTVTPVEIPAWQFLIVDSGERRSLATSAYGDRRASCAAAAAIIGPLATARLDNCTELPADLVPFARHVVTEIARVTSSITAAHTDDALAFGRLMTESHQSLSNDFLVSTPGIDALVEALNATPGIYGARMTGGGFGGCVVALCDPAVVDREGLEGRGWFVAPSAGATVTDLSGAVTILAAT
jgi:galactokinase